MVSVKAFTAAQFAAATDIDVETGDDLASVLAGGAWHLVRADAFGEVEVAIPEVVALAPPAETSGRYFVQSWNGSSRTIYSDGTNYRLASDGSIISQWWVPYGAIGHFDFENDRFWWDGEEKELTDLVDGGSNKYSLDPSFLNATFDDGMTMSVDVEMPMGETSITGNAFGWDLSPGGFGMSFNAGSAGAEYQQRLRFYTSSPSGTKDAWVTNSYGTIDYTKGKIRAVGSAKVGEVAQLVSDRGEPQEFAAVTTAFDGPATGGAGLVGDLLFNQYRNGAGGTGPLVDAVTLWPAGSTTLEMLHIAERGRWGIHWLGDSFIGSDTFPLGFNELLTNVHAWSRDGVGGTTLAQQAARFDLTPEYYHRTLVIVDGSNELVEPGVAVSAIQSMVAHLDHDRWAYVQPNPIIGFDETEFAAFVAANPTDWEDTPVTTAGMPNSDSRRIDYHNAQVEIRAFCGPDHYVPTLQAMIAARTSPGDDAQAAKGLYGPSQTGDLIHITEAGQAVFFTEIYSHGAALGWWT